MERSKIKGFTTCDRALLQQVFSDYKTAEVSDRRPRDPPILVGSGEKARKILGWQPQYSNLEDIITHAWQWHQKRHQ